MNSSQSIARSTLRPIWPREYSEAITEFRLIRPHSRRCRKNKHLRSASDNCLSGDADMANRCFRYPARKFSSICKHLNDLSTKPSQNMARRAASCSTYPQQQPPDELLVSTPSSRVPTYPYRIESSFAGRESCTREALDYLRHVPARSLFAADNAESTDTAIKSLRTGLDRTKRLAATAAKRILPALVADLPVIRPEGMEVRLPRRIALARGRLRRLDAHRSKPRGRSPRARFSTK